MLNRSRDHYEVPLALAEAGLLEALVTDFYAPAGWRRWLPPLLARRHREGITEVRTVLSSFALQYAGETLRLPMRRIFPIADRLLARTASRLARRRQAGLLAYSAYMDRPDRLPRNRPIIDFEYHPHASLALNILAEDAARHPEAKWSFELERHGAAQESVSTAWQHADVVIAASSITRRSLEFAGCAPDRIRVVPYGLTPSAAPALPRPFGAAQFLFVGQGLQRKGLHHLAHAWRAAALKNARLTVVSYRVDPGIRALLDQPGITVHDYLPRAQLLAQFAAADAFVMPSLVEGFGLVYLEALQAGCHVIGTPNTGLPDLALSPSAVTLVPPGGIDEIAEALREVAARKDAGELHPAAIQAESSNHDWSVFRRQIAQIAQEAAGTATR